MNSCPLRCSHLGGGHRNDEVGHHGSCNVCTPHASLCCAEQPTIPAMAVGITDPCWTMEELLSFHVPPPRWMLPKQCGRSL
jgi:hypothetical protein